MAENSNQIVVDKASSRISDLWKNEDYWAIWLGFVLLVVGLAIYIPRAPHGMKQKIAVANQILAGEADKAPFKTLAWYQAVDSKRRLKAVNSDAGKKIKEFTAQPRKWYSSPTEAFFMSREKALEKSRKAVSKYRVLKKQETSAFLSAQKAEKAAEAEGFKNPELNSKATTAIGKWRKAYAKAGKTKKKLIPEHYNQIIHLVALMTVLAIFFGVGKAFMGESIVRFMIGFAFVFMIAVLAYLGANNAVMKHYGIGYAAWAIVLGLIVSNTIGVPNWVLPALETEYYIKTGLVLLGAEVLFGKILSIGIPGVFVAWGVTPLVLIIGYWFGDRFLKMKSKTLNITISASFSVCGVSAAIAVAAACKAKKEELTLAVGLSLIFTSVMMIVMPLIINMSGMDHVLGGAWMGGTIDATGAVAAAGAFLSERALYVSATIKMIQNVLIGLIAFAIAVYWTVKIEKTSGGGVGAAEVWRRFPKFVIGFIAASIIFSLIYQSLGQDSAYVLIDHGVIRGFSKMFRGWFFCLAFASIGLATNFRELKSHFKGGQPFVLYIVGQSLNLFLTLGVAYVMFFWVFPEITNKI